MCAMPVCEKDYLTERVVGYWSVIPNVQIHEIMGMAGYQFAIVDLEHGSYSFQEALESIVAIQFANMDAYIRPSGHDEKEILRCLELGVQGICIPHVKNKDEAIKVVSSCYYPPFGVRGASGFTRSSHYGNGSFNEHSIKQNSTINVVLLIECFSALENIEEIASVPGVDGIYFGTYDIASSMGIEQQDSRVVQKAISNAIERIAGLSIFTGQVAVDHEQYANLDPRIKFVPIGVDCGIFLRGAKDNLMKSLS